MSQRRVRYKLRAWNAVRVLSGPPRILSKREISRRRRRSPQLAGFYGYVSVSADTVSGPNAILGGLSLGRGIPFPRCRMSSGKADVLLAAVDPDLPRKGRHPALAGRRRWVSSPNSSPNKLDALPVHFGGSAAVGGGGGAPTYPAPVVVVFQLLPMGGICRLIDDLYELTKFAPGFSPFAPAAQGFRHGVCFS
jgi:hypothetical protein